jgi:adenylosuccinate synthase
MSVTKLDVLTGLNTLKICVGYELQGKRVDSRPSSLKSLAQCSPIYEEMPGWEEDISQARKLDDLPKRAREYLNRIEELTEVPFSIISIGPGREQTIVHQDLF